MMAPASLLREERIELEGGFFVEIKIWQLPLRTSERPHGLKYSLFYGNRNGRIIGYDNEAGKGDHRHYRDREESYAFQSLDRMLADFWADVRRQHGRD